MEPNSKRRRTSQDFVHDKELWMEDGNIIITATDESSEDKTTYAFKCHRSVLAKQSKVFEGLLTIPPSTEARDLYEGLPLIALSDPYADVKGLLGYLYEPGRLPRDNKWLWDIEQTNKTTKAIAGPLRLAIKYEFTELRTSLEGGLASIWPTTLAELDIRRKWLDDASRIMPMKAPPLSCAALAATLGYDTQRLDVIPGAFYILNYELNNLVKSFETTCYRSYQYNRNEKAERLAHSAESLLSDLPPHLLYQFLASRALLQATARNMLRSAMRASYYVVDCKGEPKPSNIRDYELEALVMSGPDLSPCAYTFRGWWIWALRPTPYYAFSKSAFDDPLRIFDELVHEIRTDEHAQDICLECKSAVVAVLKEMRQGLWSELPYIFAVRKKGPGEGDWHLPSLLKDSLFTLGF